MKREVITSIFTHATSQKNCSTALPGSPICSIFHGVKRLFFEQQNTLTINHAEFEPSQGDRHIIGELVSAHVRYAWMLINWNGPEGCGRRTRNRSTTWSGLTCTAAWCLLEEGCGRPWFLSRECCSVFVRSSAGIMKP